ncbi:MAG: PQQ-binding-like beta-propeller repeat protein [Phycisphaerae bacterium]|nr:PQQ-binding-like beta-propeller repeat protein [Phycisphaerae bacterium]
MRERWSQSLWTVAAATCVALSRVATAPALAQSGPVYPDDSVQAHEGLVRVRELAAAGNAGEGVRVLQSLLDSESDRVLVSETDADLFVSVRARVHALLLKDPALLDRYRGAEEAKAADLLGKGEHAAVERSRLLTRSGFEACLRVAQEHLERARFEAALIALRQLEDHPDRAADPRAGGDAASLAALLARYLLRDDVRALAERWASQAGVGAGAAGAFTLPNSAPVLTPVRALARAELSGLVKRPIQTAWMSNEAKLNAEYEAARSLRDDNREWFLRSVRDEAWATPAVVGDRLLVNDGQCVSCLDRFTLQTLWSFTPELSGTEQEAGATTRRDSLRALSMVEDTTGVGAGEGVAVAATGYAAGERRDGDPRVYAFDLASGARLWSASPAAMDASLGQAVVRGQIELGEGVVLVPLRKIAASKRVASVHMAALDLFTGELRWARTLASAGWVGAQRFTKAADVLTVHDGHVYKCDELGVVASIEAATGRVAWVRRMTAEPFTGRGESLPPWGGVKPLVVGESLVTLTPGRDAIVRLDRATGAVTGRRASSELGEPMFLVAVDGWIAAVSQDRVVFVDESFEKAEVRIAPPMREKRPTGRAIAAGERLLVPTTGALLSVDPSRPDAPASIELERLGNTIAVDGQVISTDRYRAYSYLNWEFADRVLSARLDADGRDPGPGVTLAELAYRAGRFDRVAPAADRAAEAITRAMGDPARAESAARARATLYANLRAMIEAGQERLAKRDATDESPAITDLGVLDALVARLARLADSNAERVAATFALGRLRQDQALAKGEDATRLAQAVDAYQKILEDAGLSGATWTSAGRSVRADLDATTRVMAIVQRAGRGVYAVHEQQLARQLELLGPTPDAEKLTELARVFPASERAADLYLSAAAMHEQAGRVAESITCLDRALEQARWALPLSGADPAAARRRLGESAGRLLTAFVRTDRVTPAAQLIERVRREFPDIPLTSRGEPIKLDAVAAELRSKLAAMDRRPRLGDAISGEVQSLVGWQVLRPLTGGGGARPTDQVLLHSPASRQVALFAPQADGTLGPSWTISYRDRAPTLVSIDVASALFFWPSDEGGVLERVLTVGGTSAWRTPAFAAMFAEPNAAPHEIIDTPRDGSVRKSDMLVTLDQQVVVLADHGGRVAAVDIATGRVLWRQATALSRVYDMIISADARGTALVLGGRARATDAAGESPGVLALDLRTGASVQLVRGLPGEVAWVRVGNGAAAIGMDDRVMCLNIADAGVRWMLAEPQVQGSLSAWVFGESLYVLSAGREVVQVDLAKGQRREAVLDTRRRLAEPSPIEAVLLSAGPESRLVFMAKRGVAVFDREGTLVGLDAFDAGSELLTPELADGVAVAVEANPRPSDAGTEVVGVHLLSMPSAKLLYSRDLAVGAPPRDVVVLDNRVVLTAGNVTLVLPAPAK